MPTRNRCVVVALLVALIVFTKAGARTSGPPVLSSYLVESANDAALQEIGRSFEMTGRHGDLVEVIVPEDKVGEFLQLAPAAQLIEADITDIFQRIERADPQWLASYHSFDQVQNHLEAMTDPYFDHVSLETYGQSPEGRPLVALKVGGGEGKSAVLITGGVHGGDLFSTEVVFGLLDELIEGLNDERLARLLDNHVVYFIPVVNPDAFVHRERYLHGNEAIAALTRFSTQRGIRATLDFRFNTHFLPDPGQIPGLVQEKLAPTWATIERLK